MQCLLIFDHMSTIYGLNASNPIICQVTIFNGKLHYLLNLLIFIYLRPSINIDIHKYNCVSQYSSFKSKSLIMTCI